MLEIFIPILTTIIGAVLGSLGTFLITKYKYKYEEKRQKEEDKKKLVEAKPDFEIINFWNFDQFSKLENKTADLDVFVSKLMGVDTGSRFRAIYDKSDLDRINWITQRFEFKNTGKTEVMHLYIICNHKKSACLFNTQYSVDSCITNELLSYSEILEKRIKPYETFSLNISFHKDRIISGMFSAPFSLGLCDKNNNYWEQPLFAPENKLYTSYSVSFKDFRNDIDFEMAMKCFRNPDLW
ncbi:MAG TPA: hypothetical protein PKV66_03220 [Candidatus Pelethenecus sp.]|nr:hypothetical protein [Candidatus Pelethenecus sp.]